MVNTESDTILQEYYITRRYKSTIHEGIYIIKAERCSRYDKRGLESQIGEKLGGRTTTMSELLLHSDYHGRIHCATLISYSKAIMVQTLESGHENLGLSDATLQVHIIESNNVHNSYMCTSSSDVVQVCGTRNDK